MQNRPDNLVDRIYKKFVNDERGNPYVNHVMRSCLASADDMGVFAYGEEINPATKALIERADEEVLMQFYNFNDVCEAGRDVKLALISLNAKAAEANKVINIKMLVNYRKGLAAYFTKKADDPFAWLQQDDQGVYFNLDNKKHYLNCLDIQTKLHIHYFFDSYHSKKIIVDRKFMMVRSGDITKSFDCANGERLQTELATLVMNEQVAQHAAASFHEKWSDDEVYLLKTCVNISPNVAVSQDIPVLLMEKNASTNMIHKMVYHSPYKISLIETIASAEKCVKIMTSNINDEDIIDAIVQALKRGIHVQLFTGKYANDKRESYPGMGGTNLENVNKIYELIPTECWDNFQVRWACDETGALISDGSPKMMHGKLAIIDDAVVLTGTSPMDRQSAYFSEESDILVVSAEIAEKYLAIFRPAYDAGESFNFYSLLNLKNELSRSVSRGVNAPIVSEDNVHVSQKVIFIEVLAKLIQDSEDFSSLVTILKLSLAIDDGRSQMKVSALGLFSNTGITQELQRIYNDHGIKFCNDGIFANMQRISM